MSEYQYVEFRAIDAPVSDKNLEFMHKQSTRAEIGSTATWEARLVLLLLAFQIGSSVACGVLLAINAT